MSTPTRFTSAKSSDTRARQPPLAGRSLTPRAAHPPSLLANASRPSSLAYSYVATDLSHSSGFINNGFPRTQRRTGNNPFLQLGAGDFDHFINDITRKIRGALAGPPVAATDDQIQELGATDPAEVDSMDVFGGVRQGDQLHEQLSSSVETLTSPEFSDSRFANQAPLFAPVSSSDDNSEMEGTLELSEEVEVEGLEYDADEDMMEEELEADLDEIDEYIEEEYDEHEAEAEQDTISPLRSRSLSPEPVTVTQPKFQSAASLYRDQLEQQHLATHSSESESDDDLPLTMDQLFPPRHLPTRADLVYADAVESKNVLFEKEDIRLMDIDSGLDVEASEVQTNLRSDTESSEAEEGEDESQRRRHFAIDTPQSLSPAPHREDEESLESEIEIEDGTERFVEGGSSEIEFDESVDGERDGSIAETNAEAEMSDDRIPSWKKGKGRADTSFEERSTRSRSTTSESTLDGEQRPGDQYLDNNRSIRSESVVSSANSISFAGYTADELFNLCANLYVQVHVAEEENRPPSIQERLARNLSTLERVGAKRREEEMEIQKNGHSEELDAKDETTSGEWSVNPTTSQPHEDNYINQIADLMLAMERQGQRGPAQVRLLPKRDKDAIEGLDAEFTNRMEEDEADFEAEQERDNDDDEVIRDTNVHQLNSIAELIGPPLKFNVTSDRLPSPPASPNEHHNPAFSSDYIAAVDNDESVNSDDMTPMYESVRSTGLLSLSSKIPPPSQVGILYDYSGHTEFGQELEESGSEEEQEEEEEEEAAELKEKRETEIIVLDSDSDEAESDYGGNDIEYTEHEEITSPTGSAHSAASLSSSPRVTNVLDAGEWDPSTPIRFGGASLLDAIGLMSASDRLSSEISIDRSDDLVIEDSGECKAEAQTEEEKDVEEIDDCSIIIEDGEQDAHGAELSVKISGLDEPDWNDCADSVDVPIIQASTVEEMSWIRDLPELERDLDETEIVYTEADDITSRHPILDIAIPPSFLMDQALPESDLQLFLAEVMPDLEESITKPYDLPPREVDTAPEYQMAQGLVAISSTATERQIDFVIPSYILPRPVLASTTTSTSSQTTKLVDLLFADAEAPLSLPSSSLFSGAVEEGPAEEYDGNFEVTSDQLFDIQDPNEIDVTSNPASPSNDSNLVEFQTILSEMEEQARDSKEQSTNFDVQDLGDEPEIDWRSDPLIGRFEVRTSPIQVFEVQQYYLEDEPTEEQVTPAHSPSPAEIPDRPIETQEETIVEEQKDGELDDVIEEERNEDLVIERKEESSVEQAEIQPESTMDSSPMISPLDQSIVDELGSNEEEEEPEMEESTAQGPVSSIIISPSPSSQQRDVATTLAPPVPRDIDIPFVKIEENDPIPEATLVDMSPVANLSSIIGDTIDAEIIVEQTFLAMEAPDLIAIAEVEADERAIIPAITPITEALAPSNTQSMGSSMEVETLIQSERVVEEKETETEEEEVVEVNSELESNDGRQDSKTSPTVIPSFETSTIMEPLAQEVEKESIESPEEEEEEEEEEEDSDDELRLLPSIVPPSATKSSLFPPVVSSPAAMTRRATQPSSPPEIMPRRHSSRIASTASPPDNEINLPKFESIPAPLGRKRSRVLEEEEGESEMSDATPAKRRNTRGGSKSAKELGLGVEQQEVEDSPRVLRSRSRGPIEVLPVVDRNKSDGKRGRTDDGAVDDVQQGSKGKKGKK